MLLLLTPSILTLSLLHKECGPLCGTERPSRWGERPTVWGGTTCNFGGGTTRYVGRIDPRGADRSGADRPWGGSTGTRL